MGECMRLARALVITLIFLQLPFGERPIRPIDDRTPARTPVSNFRVTQLARGVGRAPQRAEAVENITGESF